jgi:hypothetical protein
MAGPAVEAPVEWQGMQADNDGHVFAKTATSELNPPVRTCSRRFSVS